MMESLSTFKLRQLLHQDVERAHLFATVSRQPATAGIGRSPKNTAFHHLQYRFASYLVEPSAPPFFRRTRSRGPSSFV